jgi:hypothetical protein
MLVLLCILGYTVHRIMNASLYEYWESRGWEVQEQEDGNILLIKEEIDDEEVEI